MYTLVKRTSPHSIVTKKMYKKISSVHGSSVLTVKGMQLIEDTLKDPTNLTLLPSAFFKGNLMTEAVM